MRHRTLTRVIGAAAGSVLAASTVVVPAAAADPPPSYLVTYLGDGFVTGLSNTGVVIGGRAEAFRVVTPYVSTGGSPWRTLPLPTGATGATPADVNDSGVIAGTATFAAGSRAVRWTPTAGGYAVEVLPLTQGQTQSVATGINDAGQIVGGRLDILGLPTSPGWVAPAGGDPVALLDTFGFGGLPVDVTDGGVVLSAVELLDLGTGVVMPIPQGPSSYNPVAASAINEAGQLAGAATLRSTSLVIQSVLRYSPGPGWSLLAGSSRYAVAADINDLGDVTFGTAGLDGTYAPGVDLVGVGQYGLGTLLSMEARAAGWSVSGAAPRINNSRVVAALGSNLATGQRGVVLLTPGGTPALPPVPTALTATPHPWSTSAPFLSIRLSWTAPDISLIHHFELERSLAGQGAWGSVPLVPPGLSTSHDDTTVTPGVTYDYRVRAVNTLGPSAWSNVATATAPRHEVLTPLQVSGISLSGTVKRGVATIRGVVTVVSEGASVAGAQVNVVWHRPDGSTLIQSVVTGSRGRAAFSVSGSRGTYTLTVTDVAKAGYALDTASSVLSASITK